MDKNFTTLLRTSSKTVTNQDSLRKSKTKISNICKGLCLPSNKYKPKKTIEAIQNYIGEKTTKGRILYSEITSFVYGLSEDEQGTFATNIETLLLFSLDENNNVDGEHCKIIVKLYDHVQLALRQMTLTANTENVLKERLVSSMASAKEVLKNDIEDDFNVLKNNFKHIEKEYITILGIFAAIVLAFVGGITFSSSVLQNINAVSVYRLIMVIDLLAIILSNTIYILLKCIFQINNIEDKFPNIKVVSIIFISIGILTIIAWVLDVGAFSEFIRKYLPWIN